MIIKTIFIFFIVLSAARAETGVVSVTGSGRDTGEAIVSLLRSTVVKYFKADQAIVRPILQTEILPNASSFVQSYKVLDGSRGGSVSINASIDLDVLRGLFALSPKSLGETSSAKALVYVHSSKSPESLKNINPYAVLETAVKERFQRRQFELVALGLEEVSSITQGEDGAGPEILRGLATKTGARIAVGINARMEKIENENSHKDEERVFLSAILLDVKTGTIMGKSSANFLNPSSKKEQYITDLQKVLIEESRDLLQDLFVAGGRKINSVDTKDSMSIIRVLNPNNPATLAKFRVLLESLKGAKSVVEYQVRRGAFDLAIRPAMESMALQKNLKAINSDEIVIEFVLQNTFSDLDTHPPALSVKLSPKATPSNSGEESSVGGIREKL